MLQCTAYFCYYHSNLSGFNVMAEVGDRLALNHCQTSNAHTVVSRTRCTMSGVFDMQSERVQYTNTFKQTVHVKTRAHTHTHTHTQVQAQTRLTYMMFETERNYVFTNLQTHTHTHTSKPLFKHINTLAYSYQIYCM